MKRVSRVSLSGVEALADVERLAFEVDVFFVVLLPALPVLLALLLPFAPALLPLTGVAFVASGFRDVPWEDTDVFTNFARCSIRVLCTNLSLGLPIALLGCPGPGWIRSPLRLFPLFWSLPAMTESLLSWIEKELDYPVS